MNRHSACGIVAQPTAAAVAWAPAMMTAGDAIYLKQLELGPMQNFVYLVGDPVARQCVVVDPAWEIDTIVNTAAADDMTLIGALVTHTHQDHVGGSLASWGMPGRIPGVDQLLGALPDDTRLFPGHNYGGPSSTIGDEKRENPFMRFPSLGDFLRVMGGGRA